MAVLINDLEIIVEPPSGGQEQAASESPPPPQTAAPIAPNEVVAIVRHQASRRSRLRAH